MSFDYACGSFLISPSTRSVYLQGQPVALGSRAFDLLLALLERRDRVVDKQELLTLVWPGLVVEEGNLSVQVSTLRKVLGQAAITTVPGRGYRFTAPALELVPGSLPVAKAAASDASPQAQPVAPAAAPLVEPKDQPAETLAGWLPTAMTPLLGRSEALAHTQHLLQSTRCLTLTGAGGAGKTRLALALAHAVHKHYPGGVWWVGLDTLNDPTLLAQALAGALGGTQAHVPALPALTARLAGRKTLLVLDNCEHLIEHCADLATLLLTQLPQLQLLCTSRESLRLAGEVVWPVPPLAVPDAAEARASQVEQHASVQLLVQRIGQHNPGFALTADNAASLAAICRGLDGLPLALELVAAQVGLRTPAQVAARLDRSLALLHVGPRGGMRHHQTMAAAVDWGYRLLGDMEQTVFLRLSVLLGGWSLDGAAAVSEDLDLGEDQLPEVMGRLLRASMVLALPATHHPGAAVRFRMLEPIRQFALAQLEEQGQVDAVKQQALSWYGRQGKRLAAQLAGPQQALGYAFLESEFDNLRALLAWSKGHDAATGLQLASDLWRFWQVKGHAKEMLAWFDEVLPQAQALPQRLQAEASNTAGSMARTCGQYAKARTLYQTSLELQRGLANRKGEANALNNLCLIARDQHDHAAVMDQGSACLAIAREMGDRNLEGLALMHLGTALRGQDLAAQAQASFRQSLAIFSELGEKRAQGTLLNFLGKLALAEGDWAEAERCFQEGLAINRHLEDFWGLGISNCNLAALHLAKGNDGQALQMVQLSLANYRRAGARHGMEECFELLARLARRHGQAQHAAWCWGVVEQLERDMGKAPSPAQQAQREQALHALSAMLPPATCSAARAQGQRVTLEDAFAAALAEPEGTPVEHPFGRQLPVAPVP